MKRHAVLLAAALLFSGCSWFDLSDSQGDDLTGTLWSLDSIAVVGGETEFATEEGETYNVLFDEDGSIRGKSACNECRGSYELGGGDSIDIGFICTEIGCGRYYRYDELMLAAESYELEGDRLRLYATSYDGKRYVLPHHAAAE